MIRIPDETMTLKEATVFVANLNREMPNCDAHFEGMGNGQVRIIWGK